VLYAILKRLIAGVLRLGFRFRAIGIENVPARGPVLLAANHVSALDPPAIGAGAPRPLHYLAKAELFRVPLLGPLIRRLNAYPVRRAGADAAALRRALGLLREGRAVLVFPEGTRGAEGAVGPGKPGAGMLAALSGAPVVPVFVRGTGRVLPRGARWPRRAAITVAYGPPIRFEHERGKNGYQSISDEIMAAIARLQAGVTGSAPGVPPPPPRTTRNRTARASRPWAKIIDGRS
jgi:1-acyl-sn-glycerol-3-phosphate acyltransferase